MTEIWKYPLRPGSNCIEMPAVVSFLSVEFQGEQLYLWCWVTPRAEVESYHILATATGIPLPDNRLRGPSAYIGTAQCENGIVAHVFVMRKPRSGA